MKGEIQTITYQGGDFTIARLTNNTTVLGECPGGLKLGGQYTFEGDWVENAKYGRQFKFTSAQLDWDLDDLGMRKYLMTLPGIGVVTAEKLMQQHGQDALNHLPKHAKQAHETDKANNAAVLICSKLGIGPALTTRLIQHYGDKAADVASKEPYRMINEVRGVAWETADRIGKRAGINDNDQQRVRAGIMYALECAANEGHTKVSQEKLFQDLDRIGVVDRGVISGAMHQLRLDDRIVDQTDVSLQEYWDWEKSISMDIVEHKNNNPSYPHLIHNTGKATEQQLQAIKFVCQEPGVAILTGLPGTGKTTTINWLLNCLPNSDIALCAPTGKAAKRMEHASGTEAKTVHRLLEYDPKKDDWGYSLERPLPCDLVICDEASMLDVELAYRLFEAIDPGKTKLLLVGDVAQLPSVGPGNVLRDMIDGGVATFALTEIHRQAQDSGIVVNAHRINAGEFVNICSDDFLFIEMDDPEQILEEIVRQASQASDPQVLSPKKNGLLGTKNLNDVLRQELNSDNALPREHWSPFWRKDRVIHTKNNYHKMVFNGSVGTVADVWEIHEERMVGVKYEDSGIVRAVRYAVRDSGGRFVNEHDELALAYAITVHKSQGSEFGTVIIPVHKSHWYMLQRNLLYTAVTRASEKCIVIGQTSAVKQAIKNNTPIYRNTWLKGFLGEETHKNKGG